MSKLLPLSLDELLTTTRAVRKRLDFDKPVPLELIDEIIEIAVQAPTGSNAQNWHWIIITDQELKNAIAAYYKESFYAYIGQQSTSSDGLGYSEEYAVTLKKVSSSGIYLADNLAKVPVFIIAALQVGEKLPTGNQAGIWGSLLPAAWNFALAARARGLGTAWTTLHLAYERDIAKLLGIPADVWQGVLFPLAYTKGTDFQPGPRLDLKPIVHVNSW